MQPATMSTTERTQQTPDANVRTYWPCASEGGCWDCSTCPGCEQPDRRRDDGLEAECDRLREVNAELVRALERLDRTLNDRPELEWARLHSAREEARAALAKSKEAA